MGLVIVLVIIVLLLLAHLLEQFLLLLRCSKRVRQRAISHNAIIRTKLARITQAWGYLAALREPLERLLVAH